MEPASTVEPGILISPDLVTTLLRVALLVVVVWPLILFGSKMLGRALRSRLTPQTTMLIRRTVSYVGTAIIAVMILREFGFKLSALLGAAGIAGVAIGFASQTSLSNVISGLFLIGEKPFQLGDLVKIGSTRGFVHSIDMLSVKLRTFDNQYVRIPNETILKGETVNITYFPIRRMDITIGVAYKEDLERVLRILKELANDNPHCLNEPEPHILLQDFGDSSINILVGLWFYKTDFVKLRNSFIAQVKKRFDEEGIEIPFPHRTLYTGSETAPFPIKIVGQDGSGHGHA